MRQLTCETTGAVIGKADRSDTDVWVVLTGDPIGADEAQLTWDVFQAERNAAVCRFGTLQDGRSRAAKNDRMRKGKARLSLRIVWSEDIVRIWCERGFLAARQMTTRRRFMGVC